MKEVTRVFLRCDDIERWRDKRDKSLKVRQEHNINIGKISLTKRNITAQFLMFLTFYNLYTYFVITNNIYNNIQRSITKHLKYIRVTSFICTG